MHTIQGQIKVTHITDREDLKTLCGKVFDYTEKSNPVRWNPEKGVEEEWTCLDNVKWVRISSFKYCQRCLKSLKKSSST